MCQVGKNTIPSKQQKNMEGVKSVCKTETVQDLSPKEERGVKSEVAGTETGEKAVARIEFVQISCKVVRCTASRSRSQTSFLDPVAKGFAHLCQIEGPIAKDSRERVKVNRNDSTRYGQYLSEVKWLTKQRMRAIA